MVIKKIIETLRKHLIFLLVSLQFEIDAKLLTVIKEVDFDKLHVVHALPLSQVLFKMLLHIFDN